MATKPAFLGEQPRWTEAKRAKRRERYARYESTGHAGRAQSVTVPGDITVLTRDPFPCGYCGKREPCRHRPWEAAHG
jgi:hypothetical protein